MCVTVTFWKRQSRQLPAGDHVILVFLQQQQQAASLGIVPWMCKTQQPYQTRYGYHGQNAAVNTGHPTCQGMVACDLRGGVTQVTLSVCVFFFVDPGLAE